MRVNLFILFFLLSVSLTFSQQSYRKDSLQLKVYTEMYVNKNIKIDSINVAKVFCDYCSENQIKKIEEESLYRTEYEIHNPRYQKEGIHIIAIYLRISKDDFSKMK